MTNLILKEDGIIYVPTSEGDVRCEDQIRARDILHSRIMIVKRDHSYQIEGLRFEIESRDCGCGMGDDCCLSRQVAVLQEEPTEQLEKVFEQNIDKWQNEEPVEKKEKSDNELIAEFMGIVFKKEIDGVKYYDVPEGQYTPYNASQGVFNYHKSWDWLMPAIKKWDDLLLPDEPETRQEYFKRSEAMDEAVTNEYDINEAYPVLVDNIKWYNSNKEK